MLLLQNYHLLVIIYVGTIVTDGCDQDHIEKSSLFKDRDVATQSVCL